MPGREHVECVLHSYSHEFLIKTLHGKYFYFLLDII